MAEIQVTGTAGTVAVIDKAFPHSRFDVMIIASNNEIRSSCADLDESTSSVVWALASEFRKYISQPAISARFELAGCEIHQVFNYSRDTVDRENGQFYDKRFHLHMNCWPASDLRDLVTVPLGAIEDAVTRRRMLDPLAYLGPLVMKEYLGSEIEGYEIMPVDVNHDIEHRLPPGLKVRLDGLRSLSEPRYSRLLRRLHHSADDIYRSLFRALTGQDHAPRAWHRENLLSPSAIMRNVDQVTILGEETRQLLHRLALCLRNVSDQDMETFRSNKALASRYLTLAGLDYSIGLCSSGAGHFAARPQDAQLYVVMQFRLLGDVGSASLPPLRQSCMALLDRKGGPVLSGAELRERHEFIRRFLNDALPKLEASRLAMPLHRSSR